MTTYERSVARLATGLFLSLALSLVALFLVIDFGDWLRIYTGKPPGDVALLYWFRSHVALVQLSILVVGFIKAEVILSFLGFGVPVGTVSWGSMLNEAQNELLLGRWWQLAAAASAMALLVTPRSAARSMRIFMPGMSVSPPSSPNRFAELYLFARKVSNISLQATRSRI